MATGILAAGEVAPATRDVLRAQRVGHVAGVHLTYLVGYKNRLTTLPHWAHSLIGRGRAERVITRRS